MERICYAISIYCTYGHRSKATTNILFNRFCINSRQHTSHIIRKYIYIYILIRFSWNFVRTCMRINRMPHDMWGNEGWNVNQNLHLNRFVKLSEVLDATINSSNMYNLNGYYLKITNELRIHAHEANRRLYSIDWRDFTTSILIFHT